MSLSCTEAANLFAVASEWGALSLWEGDVYFIKTRPAWNEHVMYTTFKALRQIFPFKTVLNNATK